MREGGKSGRENGGWVERGAKKEIYRVKKRDKDKRGGGRDEGGRETKIREAGGEMKEEERQR